VSKKNIWIISQYSSTPETGIGGRHYYLARELARQGHEVHLIAASYTHLLRRCPDVDDKYRITKSDGFNFVWVKTPVYSNANSFRRILNWFLFSRRLGGLPKVIDGCPDTIIYSSPSLVPYLGAYRLAKRFGSKLVWDVRDVWPLTLIELGGYSRWNPFVVFSNWIESFACKTSNHITSNLPYAIDHLSTKGASRDKFDWIPNGYCAEEQLKAVPLPDEILGRLPQDKFIVGYCGTLGTANAIDVMLDVAQSTCEDESIAYLLVGGGNLRSHILEVIKKNSLLNIVLLDPIPKRQVPSMLSSFDVCYAGMNKSPLYRYGTSLTKLPEYLISGKPLVFSADSPAKPVEDANAGITVGAEDVVGIVAAIYKLQSMSGAERKKLGENGVRYAEEHYEFSKLAKKLSSIL
jgi:glycosyltransferase involved in cell wall biosynthesis